MGYACCCGDDDGESAQVYQETFPVARITHRCCECGAPILPGQKYHHVRGLWDEHWSSHRTCMPCHRIRENYCQCGFAFGDLQRAILDCHGFNYCEVDPDDDDDD